MTMTVVDDNDNDNDSGGGGRRCLSNGRCCDDDRDCDFDGDFDGEEESSKLLQSSYSLGGGTHYHITSTSYRCHHAGQTLIFASNDIYGI